MPRPFVLHLRPILLLLDLRRRVPLALQPAPSVLCTLHQFRVTNLVLLVPAEGRRRDSPEGAGGSAPPWVMRGRAVLPPHADLPTGVQPAHALHPQCPCLRCRVGHASFCVNNAAGEGGRRDARPPKAPPRCAALPACMQTWQRPPASISPNRNSTGSWRTHRTRSQVEALQEGSCWAPSCLPSARRGSLPVLQTMGTNLEGRDISGGLARLGQKPHGRRRLCHPCKGNCRTCIARMQSTDWPCSP